MSVPPILYFDGVCNLCSTSVQFVLDHERDSTLHFAPLQSSHAQEVLLPLGIDPADLDSVVLVENGVAFTRSTAIFEIAAHLKAPWSWVAVLRFLPRFFSDFCYRIVAVNRYRFFGKKDACMIPTPQLKARFL